MNARRLSRRRRRWRMVLWAAGALGALAALTAGFCWYGWRYGFTPLPEAAPSVAIEFPPKLSLEGLTPTNYWHWVAVLESALPRGDRVQVLDFRKQAATPQPELAPPSGDEVQARFVSSLLEWSRYGAVALTNREELVRWVGAHLVLEECYRNALLNPQGISARLDAATGERLVWHRLLLALYPLWLAQQAELEGRKVEAFDHLLAAWRTSAQANPRWQTHYAGWGGLAKCWRRLALAGPRLAPEEGRRLLEGLSAATNLLPSLEAAYLQDASRWREDAEEDWWLEEVDGAYIRERFEESFAEIGKEILSRLERMAGGDAGGQSGSACSAEGIGHLSWPLRFLLTPGMRAAARPQDCDQLRSAYFSQVVARLRLGQPDEAEAYAKALRRFWHEKKFSMLFDRPEVWSSIGWCPSPARAVAASVPWRCDLESSRLTLALRCYRDRHGAWPDRLEDLVPEVLPAVPVEPCTRSPFLYEKDGDSWRVRAGPKHRGYDDVSLAEQLRSRYGLRLRGFRFMPEKVGSILLCSSEEAKEAPARWEQQLRAEQAAAAAGPAGTQMMDLRMLQRYGLIPKGYKPKVKTNAPPASAAAAPSTNAPAVTNLSAGL